MMIRAQIGSPPQAHFAGEVDESEQSMYLYFGPEDGDEGAYYPGSDGPSGGSLAGHPHRTYQEAGDVGGDDPFFGDIGRDDPGRMLFASVNPGVFANVGGNTFLTPEKRRDVDAQTCSDHLSGYHSSPPAAKSPSSVSSSTTSSGKMASSSPLRILSGEQHPRLQQQRQQRQQSPRNKQQNIVLNINRCLLGVLPLLAQPSQVLVKGGGMFCRANDFQCPLETRHYVKWFHRGAMPTVVQPLWRVPHFANCVLMIKFFSLLLRAQSKSKQRRQPRSPPRGGEGGPKREGVQTTEAAAEAAAGADSFDRLISRALRDAVVWMKRASTAQLQLLLSRGTDDDEGIILEEEDDGGMHHDHHHVDGGDGEEEEVFYDRPFEHAIFWGHLHLEGAGMWAPHTRAKN